MGNDLTLWKVVWNRLVNLHSNDSCWDTVVHTLSSKFFSKCEISCFQSEDSSVVLSEHEPNQVRFSTKVQYGRTLHCLKRLYEQYLKIKSMVRSAQSRTQIKAAISLRKLYKISGCFPEGLHGLRYYKWSSFSILDVCNDWMLKMQYNSVPI